MKQEVSRRGQEIGLPGWVISHAERRRCLWEICESAEEHVFSVHRTWIYMMTTNRWPSAVPCEKTAKRSMVTERKSNVEQPAVGWMIVIVWEREMHFSSLLSFCFAFSLSPFLDALVPLLYPETRHRVKRNSWRLFQELVHQEVERRGKIRNRKTE